MEATQMFEVNVTMLASSEVLIASGNPRMTAGPEGSVKFFDTNYFVLHFAKNGITIGIITPRRQS